MGLHLFLTMRMTGSLICSRSCRTHVRRARQLLDAAYTQSSFLLVAFTEAKILLVVIGVGCQQCTLQ